jgi:hypothetical protein
MKDNPTLEDITAVITEFREVGGSEEEITKTLKEFGYTPASYELALKHKSEKKDKGEGFWTTVDKYIRGDSDVVKMGGGDVGSGLVRDLAHAQDSFTSGASIYARAGIKSLQDKAKTGEWNWDKNLKMTRAEIQDYMLENPVSSKVAEVAGGTAQALVPLGNVMKATKIGKYAQAGKPVRKTIKEVGTGLVVGGGASGSQTALLAGARGEEDVGKQSLLATALGGATGGVLPLFAPIGKGLAGGYKIMMDNPKVLNTMDELGEGFDQIKAFFMKDGKLSGAVKQKYEKIKQLGLGDDVMAVDLIDEVGVEKAGSFLRLGDPTSDTIRVIRESLRSRLMNTKEKAVDFITSASGQVRKGIQKQKDYLMNRAREQAKPHYQEAYFRVDEQGNKIYNTIVNPEIDEIMLRPDFMEAYKVAERQARNSVDGKTLPKFPLEQRYRMVEDPNSDYFVDGLPMTFDRDQAGNLIPISNEPVEWPVWALDSAKKYLDRKYKYAHLPDAPPALKGSKPDITELKTRMVTLTEDAHPAYKTARSKYQGQAELEDAFEQGADLWKPSLSKDDAEYVWKQLEMSQRDSFKLGAYNSMMDWIERAGEGKNPRAVADYFKSEQNLNKLTWLVPNPKERRRLLARLDVLGERIYVDNVLLKNSLTASRQAMDDDTAIGTGLQMMQDVKSRNAPAVVTALERGIAPEIAKKKATSGAKFAFEQGEKVGENLKSAEGLLTKRAMTQGKYDPMGLLSLGVGGSSTVGGDYDNRKKRKAQGAR